MLQYIPYLSKCGHECVSQALIVDSALQSRYATGRHSPSGAVVSYSRRWNMISRRGPWDLVWVEKEVFPWLPSTVDLWAMHGRHWVLDLDDAIFHSYDMHSNPAVQLFLGRRVDRTMAAAHMVFAGNEYLARRSTDAGCRRVEVIPTVVDESRYSPGVAEKEARTPVRLVWMGSPSTSKYLSLVRGALEVVARDADIELRVVGAKVPPFEGVRTECLPWSIETEAEYLRDCDIGLMPLFDTPWEQGKCAYKLIQYMASGLPTVASDVGANASVTRVGETGFLAQNEDEWIASLNVLVRDSEMRLRLGAHGRRVVENQYSINVTAPLVEHLLQSVVGG
jgi:glycosyltransferase involved in cell wall biosynthesis